MTQNVKLLYIAKGCVEQFEFHQAPAEGLGKS